MPDGKKSVDDLAMFGGRPLFSSIKPVGQLFAPPVDEYVGELKQLFDGRLTGTDGAVEKLERELAEFHDVTHCVTIANACVGLIVLMRIAARERTGNVIIPAFSYSGIPHVVQWAGQTPRFCDVESVRHGLDPEAVAAAIDDETTAILAVCNVHGACEIDQLSHVAAARGVPVIFDSVSALGATYRGKPLGSFGFAEVFSLHATKMLNGFEGGYITTDDDAVAAEVRRIRDLIDGHVNYVHATLASMCLARMDDIIAANRDRYKLYETLCASISGVRLLPYVDEARERYTYQMAFVEFEPSWPLTREETINVLRSENAFAMAYYGIPLHRSSHCPPHLEVGPMPVSEDLATRFTYLPVGEHTSADDVRAVCELLALISRSGADIRDRLQVPA